MNKQFILKYEKKSVTQHNVYNKNQVYGKLYNNRSLIILFFFYGVCFYNIIIVRKNPMN